MAKEDYYELLNVSRSASHSEIKSAYRKSALKYHPDRNPDDAAAEERFKAIQAAYDQIGTAAARKEYDQQRRMEEMFARGGNPFSGFGVDCYDVTRQAICPRTIPAVSLVQEFDFCAAPDRKCVFMCVYRLPDVSNRARQNFDS